MRRYFRKEILKFLSEGLEIHEGIEQYHRADSSEMMLKTAAVCQEHAIAAGSMLEQIYGSDSVWVKQLEEYCEDIYEYSKAEEQDGALAIWKKASVLLEQLIDNIKVLKNEDTLEVLFLPYKASMWDSMESVWMAAKEDETCDSYVVPIPYFDKNSDGSLSNMHDERDDFPEYVSVTDWNTYDIEARHPDVIYIHNPYDGTNKITAVHPAYYAKKLKNHTDLLIYIPYFVCMGDVSKHFCVLPGTMYADKVIVQSKEVRETYICEFQKFEKEYNCKGFFGSAEEKFIALGSPKFDKIINTKKNDIIIPDEWMKKIRKEDGDWRKVILYNTSVTGLLAGKDNTLKKLRSVFSIMRENREFVLLWRPHPLSSVTFSAMRSKFYEEYQKLVENYVAEDWGIYDDTPDLDRAIALSDAYYGDKSSLVALFRVAGKPIMIQNTSIF